MSRKATESNRTDESRSPRADEAPRTPDEAAALADAAEARTDAVEPAAPVDPLSAACAERDEFRDKYLRAQAECANIARRLSQQHGESLKLAGIDLVRGLLPVIDNLHRTLDNLDAAKSDDPVVVGVKLILDDFEKTLRQHHVETIHAVGEPFDPAMHEALMQDFESQAAPGTVTAELMRGYKMHDRVVRPAKVAVAAEKPNAAQEERDPAASE